MSIFPEAMVPRLKDTLAAIGDQTPIRGAQPLGGGCINNAMRLDTETRTYFLKSNDRSLPGMFPCEARGLATLADTGTLRVPVVYGVAEVEGDLPAFILLEWLEGPPGDMALLGEQLALLHRWKPQQNDSLYGLDYTNYHGSSVQINPRCATWVDFFIQARLRPQAQMALANGHLSPWRRKALDRLIERLPALFGDTDFHPSLIHGDLWIANIVSSSSGLALVDPAISYSDREAEIAYTQMFGSLDPRFYQGYQSVWPLDPGYAERRDLHNLYHLLNHLNIFGEQYGPHVDAVLGQYGSSV